MNDTELLDAIERGDIDLDYVQRIPAYLQRPGKPWQWYDWKTKRGWTPVSTLREALRENYQTREFRRK